MHSPDDEGYGQVPPHRVATAALRLLLEAPWCSLAGWALRDPSAQRPAPGRTSISSAFLLQPRKSLLSAPHGSPDNVVSRRTPRGPEWSATAFIPVRKWLAEPAPVCPANGVRTFDFGQEGILGHLWSGQSLTSPTQENIDRVSTQRRSREGYSLLPELPGHLLDKIGLNSMTS